MNAEEVQADQEGSNLAQALNKASDAAKPLKLTGVETLALERGTFRGHYMVDGKFMPSDALAEQAVRTLIMWIGENPDRDGLRGTPARVLKALREMTAGLKEDPAEILKTQFDLQHDEMVILRAVPFTSLCEHHLLPFIGAASIAYVPGAGKVVGLSKLARLVQAVARRPQIQERMTGEIADAICTHLAPVGAGCVVEAEHSCLACRGARLPGARFITSALRGALKDDPRARAEFMSLIK